MAGPGVPKISNDLRVLILDDDLDDQTITAANLARGFDLHGPSSGWQRLRYDCVQTLEDARQAIRDDGYDVVIADLWLPESPNGLATIEELRSESATIPIVAVSVRGQVDTAVSSALAGADTFLPKDEISPDRLIRTVLTTLLGKRLR